MDEKIVKDSQGLAKDLVNDCISRRQAVYVCLELIHERRKWLSDAGQKEISGIDAAMCAIQDLPSAQPEITLESAINYLHSIGWMQEHDRVLTESAQPERKTGRWIDDGDPFMWECGCCGYRVKRYNNTRYCPNCGADMRGDADE